MRKVTLSITCRQSTNVWAKYEKQLYDVRPVVLIASFNYAHDLGYI